MGQKGEDYFATGKVVVWNVDILGELVIRSYRSDDPLNPMEFRRGQAADSEPAVPGWTFPVDSLFY
jgi:hypothetical protein